MRKKYIANEDEELSDKEGGLSDEDLRIENYTNGVFNFPELVNIIDALTPAIIEAVNQNNLTTLGSIQCRYNAYAAEHYAHNEHYDYRPIFADSIIIQGVSIVDYARWLGHYSIADCLEWG